MGKSVSKVEETSAEDSLPENERNEIAAPPDPLEALKDKLTTAMDKTFLEKAKLIEEIKEIADRNLLNKKELRQNTIKNWTALILGFVTLIGGAVTLFIQIDSFLEQRRKALEFTINNELLELVNMLNSKVPGTKENAALLMANYKMDAVGLLVQQLNIPLNADSAYPSPDIVIKSLDLISRKGETERKFVIESLKTESASIFAKQDNITNVDALNNFITALCYFKTSSPPADSLEFLLSRFSKQLGAHPPRSDSLLRQFTIRHIDDCLKH